MKPLGCHLARGGLEPTERGDGRSCRKDKVLHALGFDQAGRSTALKRICHMGAAIGGSTGPGDEAVSRLHTAAVRLQSTRDARAQPRHGFSRLVQGGQGGCHSDSSTGLATIWGLTAMSGCTFIMRRVCCTTSLNTGAATRPP